MGVKLLSEAVKNKIKSHGGWGTKFDMSKARVHFFLGIFGMLPRFNFLEIRILFWKDLPILGGGGGGLGFRAGPIKLGILKINA